MAAEIIGRFKNQISTPALKAAADLEKLTASATAAEGALKGLQGAGGSALPARGSGGRSAAPQRAPANSNGGAPRTLPTPAAGGSAATKLTTEEKAKASERAKSEKYVAQIKERYFVEEQRRRDKEDAAQAKASKIKAGGLPSSPGARLKMAGAAGGAAAGEAAANKLLGAAKIAAVGLGASSLGQLALGYRGMERLAGITARAQLRFRALFSGVQPKPLLDTLERVSFLFSKQTVAGRALGGIFERAFNGLFGAVKGGEPFMLDFVKGLILGALKFENALLRLRIAISPLTSALGKMFNQVGVGSAIGQVAVSLLALKLGYAAVNAARLGIAALGAAGPFFALAAAAGAAYVAIKMMFDEQDRRADASLSEEARRGNLLGKARSEARKGGVSASTQKDLEAERAAIQAKMAANQATLMTYRQPSIAGIVTGADVDLLSKQKQASIDNKALREDLASVNALMSASGAASGSAMGAGIVTGMKSAEPLVKNAGVALAKAGDAGVKAEAQIKSPARKFVTSGRRMGEGVVVGMREMEAPVQATASKSLVPDIGGAGGGARRGSGGGAVTINNYFPNYVGSHDELAAAIDQRLARQMTEMNASMGLDSEAAA